MNEMQEQDISNKEYLKHRYENKRREIAEVLARKSSKKPGEMNDEEKKRFESIVSVAAAQAFRPEMKSQTDELTGLMKKREFLKRARAQMDQVARKGGTLSMFFMDLDGFKNLNDTYGHDTGDMALKIIADELVKSVRSYDLVSRLSGDEFAVLEINGSPETAVLIADRLDKRLQEDKEKFQALKVLSVSVGVANFSQTSPQIDAKELLQGAEIAMYNAKLKSGTHVVTWIEGMTRPRKATTRR